MTEGSPTLRSRIAAFFANRRWARLLLFAVVGLPPLLGVTIGPIALMTRMNSQVKESPAYADSLKAARASAELREAIGEPIEPHYWTEAQMLQQEGEEPYPEVRYDVSGPEGTARIDYEARQEDGVWILTRAVARLPGGRTIVLRPEDESDDGADADASEDAETPADDQPAK